MGQGKEFGLNMALTWTNLISRAIPLLLRRSVCVQLISKTVAVNEEKFEPIPPGGAPNVKTRNHVSAF